MTLWVIFAKWQKIWPFLAVWKDFKLLKSDNIICHFEVGDQEIPNV